MFEDGSGGSSYSAACSPRVDKHGSALNAQRFQMLEDIAKELSGNVVFPTCFDVLVQLRKTLQDPNYTLDQVASLIALEPLISSKLLRLANSTAYNPNGERIRDLKSAINRIGLTVVRSTATGIAMNQLMQMKHLAGFEKMTRQLWEHSVYAASAARIIALRLTKLNSDEAMLAGLVHDLGAFYMIYRAAQYEELRVRPDTVMHLVIQWHESIGHTLLAALGLPEDIVDAVCDHDQPRLLPNPPRTLQDVVYAANKISCAMLGRFDHSVTPPPPECYEIGDAYQALEDEIRAYAHEMMIHFS